MDKKGNNLIGICNFQPVYRENYRIGVPQNGIYAEVFNTDDARFGGSGITNGDNIDASGEEMHDCDQSITINLPPLSVMYFSCVRKKPPRKKKTSAKKAAAKQPAQKEKGSTEK